jgi:hypothetical protein
MHHQPCPTVPRHLLRSLALAAALGCAGAHASSVDVTAANAFGFPGGTAVVDIDFSFTGPYHLDSLALRIEFDPLALAWDRPATTFTYAGTTRSLDAAVTAFNALFIAQASVAAGSDHVALNLRFFNPPPLDSVVSLHAAFTLLSPAMDDGAWSDLRVFGQTVEQTKLGEIIDTPFLTSARINTVAAVPEPHAAGLFAAGLLALGALVHRRRPGRPACG